MKRSGATLMRGGPIKHKAGGKVDVWRRVWATIKPAFEAAGITRCEVRKQGCTGASFLTPAHSKKRRNIIGLEIAEVCLACVPCHAKLELMKEADMTAAIRDIINRRAQPLNIDTEKILTFI